VRPLNMSYPQDTCLWRSCLVWSTCIFLVIHVGYISSYCSPLTTYHSQDLGASSQYVVSSRHVIGSVPQDLIVRLDDGYTCYPVQLNHSDYLTAEREWQLNTSEQSIIYFRLSSVLLLHTRTVLIYWTPQLQSSLFWVVVPLPKTFNCL